MQGRWTSAAAAAAAGTAVYHCFLRPWHARWGATAEEARKSLPGDALVAEPAAQATRAISIDAPPERVWPWVLQIGADRGGFYSYDWLEDLFGLGIHSADRIVAGWQDRAPGDLVYADAKGRGGWYVMEVRPGAALVLMTGDPKSGRPMRRNDGLGWEFLWTFAVEEGGGGTTRLLVRERVAFGNRFACWLLAPFGLVSFIMTRRMMLGIKDRAESRAWGPRWHHELRPSGEPAASGVRGSARAASTSSAAGRR